MIELKHDTLRISCPDVHKNAQCSISFQRTLRLPDDNREYPLPPGLGQFPLAHVDDLGKKLPDTWAKRGGIYFPMYQAEALWIRFSGRYPFAIKIAAGKINAVDGEPWSNDLRAEPQNYIVRPKQPWLDGFCIAKGQVRQFVAMPLGSGYSAEEQITGEAEHGGLQIVAYPMKREYWEALQRARFSDNMLLDSCLSEPMFKRKSDMGLAPGGLMRQEIYEDEHGLEAWDTENPSRCFVHILNSQMYKALTGKRPPNKAPTAKSYTKAGLPWFDYYKDKTPLLSGSKILSGLDSIAAKGIKQGEKPLDENDPVSPAVVKKLGEDQVREGMF